MSQGSRIRRFVVLLLSVLSIARCGASQDPQASDIQIYGGKIVATDQKDARRLSTVALTTDLQVDAKTPSMLESNESFCTGILIAPRVVLTAAHCIVEGAKKKNILPHAEDYIVSFDTNVKESGKSIRAAHVIAHENYVTPSARVGLLASENPSDMGILILEEDAPSPMRPVTIASEELSLAKGTEVFLSGYGVTEKRETGRTGILRQTFSELKTVDQKKKILHIGDSKHGACAGDSGGPLYVKTETNTFEVVGVASTAIEFLGRCRGYGNSYTDVRSFRKWIKEAVAKTADASIDL